jgi:5-methylcytosine-specific restriction enzyme A
MGVEVFLFEVFKQKEYTYIGPVELADKPYQGKQTDQNAKDRHVWLFPLKPINFNQPIARPKNLIEENEQLKIAKIRKLSDQDLEKQAKGFRGTAGIVTVQSKQFTRNICVAEHAKRRAKGYCQLCQPAPFNDNNGVPCLENHHIIWLSRGGEYTIQNTVALSKGGRPQKLLKNLIFNST